MQHYRKLQSAHANQTLTMLDGTQTQRYGRLERGIIQGNCRDMHVVIADEKGFDGLGFDATIGSQDDKYAVVNLFDSANRYIDSVAIAGADDIDHAIHIALNQFDYLCPAYATLVANEGDGNFESSFDSLCWESDHIAKLMNNHSQDRGHYLPIITQKMLLTEKNRVTHNDVLWDGVNLVSHGNDYARLLVDLQKNDSHHQLTDMFDMAGFLAELNIEELGLDALMDTNNRLDLMKERLFRALVKQPMDGLTVTDVVLTKPFKKAGVANVAMQFNLSDGQTFTILFHNPDADPKKLAPQDMMVSWKWLLNKRDITAAVSPKNGENVQLAPLAMRMMKVAKANSKRFAAAQSKKAQNQQELADAQKEVDDKKAKLDTINAHIAELQGELEKVGQAKGTEMVTPSDTTDTAEPTTLESVYSELEKLGWTRKGEFIQKSFSDVAQAGSLSNGDRTLSAYFDEQERYLAVQNPMMGDNVKPYIEETSIDMRDYGYNEEGYKAAAKAFNDKVDQYVEKLREENNTSAQPVDNPTPEPQSEMNPEEVKLQKMLDEQAYMKAVNKIVKSKKSDEEVVQLLISTFGMTLEDAQKLESGRYYDGTRKGFASVTLTNLNNRIKTQQAKVDTMRKVESINNTLDSEDMVLAGVSIILNKEADRIQLDFPDKPSRDILGVLKKNGWKWSPNNQVWQRQITENAMNNARKVIQAYADDEGIDMQEESAAVGVEPPQKPIADAAKLDEIKNAVVEKLSKSTSLVEKVINMGDAGLIQLYAMAKSMVEVLYEDYQIQDIQQLVADIQDEFLSRNKPQETAMTQVHPSYSQDDIDYLNSIINGDIDPLDVDMDRIIAIGEKDETDPLFEQALQIINDAEDKATAGV